MSSWLGFIVPEQQDRENLRSSLFPLVLAILGCPIQIIMIDVDSLGNPNAFYSFIQ